MTGLRDARLREALRAAPDDGAPRPSDGTRAAIHAAARAAVARPKPPAKPARGVWQRWFGGGAMPWNAAFATVLVAVAVTLLWRHEETPGARSESPAVAQAPVPAPAAPAAPAVPAAPVAQPVPAPKPAAAPAPASPAPTTARNEAADTAAAAERSREASMASTQGPGGAAVAAAPPPAAAPAPPAAAQAFAKARQQEAVVPWEGWSELRLESDGRSVVLSRGRAQALAALVNRLARGADGNEPLDGAPTARIELSRRGVLLGVLELGGEQVRWQAVGEPGGWRTARPDAATLQAAREEIGRLLAQ